MEDEDMRELRVEELCLVAGGGENSCTESSAFNDYAGISDTGAFGQDLVNIYEGLVAATSHIIERVANAL